MCTRPDLPPFRHTSVGLGFPLALAEGTPAWKRVRGSREVGLSLTFLLLSTRADYLLSGGRFLANLEAFPAKYRAPLRRLEWDRGFLTAIRAYGSSLYLWIIRIRRKSERLCPLAFASLATLRLVLELLVVKEKLFARRKNEILPAVNALQIPVLKFHPSCPFVAVLPDTVATAECNAAPDALIAVSRVTCSTQQRGQTESTLLLPTTAYECGLHYEIQANHDPSPRRIGPSYKTYRKAATRSSGPSLYYLISPFASFFATSTTRESRQPVD
jgi:hypothetical protein